MLTGEYLGRFENTTALDASMNQIVAVEFDTYWNGIDPPVSGCHIGIDINTINSTSYMSMDDCLFVDSMMTAQIEYNSGLKLRVFSSGVMTSQKPYSTSMQRLILERY